MPKSLRMRNQALADWIERADITYESLAREIRMVAAELGDHSLRTNRSSITHWVQGTHSPGQTVIRYLVEALSRRTGRPLTAHDLGLGPIPSADEDQSLGLRIGPDPVAVFTTLGEADLKRRTLLTGTAYSVAAALFPLEHVHEMAGRTAAIASGRGRTGPMEVQAVRDMVSMFHEIDERYGGQHGRSALVQYLVSDVAALCRGPFRSEQDRADMLSAAASAVHLAGWKAYDGGQQGLGQRYFAQAYAMASASGTPGHDGWLLRTMAHQSMKLKHPDYCLDLAVSALQRAKGHVDPATESLFVITHAEALTMTGRRREGASEIRRAHDLFATSQGDPALPWAQSWGPAAANLNSRTAKTLTKLGNPGDAATHFGMAAAGRPPTYTRIHGLDLAYQAEMQLAEGHIQVACATWHRAFDQMEDVQSDRTRKAIGAVRRHLSPFHSRGERSADNLYERATLLLSASA